jgi:hypothetical protein
MKYFVVLLAVFCSFQACEPLRTDSYFSLAETIDQVLSCVESAVKGVQAVGSKLNGWVDWVNDVRATVEKLVEHKRRCDSIPRNDPPTWLQQRLIDACETALAASVTIEAGRLGLQLSKLGVGTQELVLQFQSEFERCFSIFFN